MEFKKYLNKEYIQQHKELIIKVIAIILIIVIAFFVFVIKDDKADDLYLSEKPSETKVLETKAKRIFIDVGGAVKAPKVVQLNEGSRVVDAISAAGGLDEKADLTSINRAAFLTDGQKLYIPNIGETNIPSDAAGDGSDQRSNGKVNLNTATSEELQTLTGIGPAIATRILDYRETSGPFKTIEDLKNVSGIGDKTFEKLKDDVFV